MTTLAADRRRSPSVEGAYRQEVFVLAPALTAVAVPLAVILRTAVIRLAGVLALKVRQLSVGVTPRRLALTLSGRRAGGRCHTSSGWTIAFGQLRGIHAFYLACGRPYSWDSPISGNGATA